MKARICSPLLTFAEPMFGVLTTRLPDGATKNLSASWMVQLASSLLRSSSFPGAERTITATSSKLSPLKSPTMNDGLVPCSRTRSSPKMRRTALSTSAMVGGGSLGIGSGGFCAWGVARGIGFSIGGLGFPQPNSPIEIMAAPRHANTENTLRPIIGSPEKDKCFPDKNKTGEALAEKSLLQTIDRKS